MLHVKGAMLPKEMTSVFIVMQKSIVLGSVPCTISDTGRENHWNHLDTRIGLLAGGLIIMGTTVAYIMAENWQPIDILWSSI